MIARLARSYSTTELFNFFSYGTLKMGFPNHHHMESIGISEYVCKARTIEKFPLVIATRYNMPIALEKPGVGYRIVGEVWKIDKAVRDDLDHLEVHPLFYRRSLHSVELECGSCLCCWVYLVHQFPESLLQKKFLSEYTKEESVKYVCKEDRDAKVRAMDDLEY